LKFTPIKRPNPIISEKQKEQIHDLLLKIIGETIKGKIARLTVAGAVAAGSQYLPDDPPKATVAAKHETAK
jgi:hypothetical protein